MQLQLVLLVLLRGVPVVPLVYTSVAKVCLPTAAGWNGPTALRLLPADSTAP